MGVQNQPFLATRQWQAQISYQYADTNDFYVGDQRNDAAARFGVPPRRTVNLLNLDVVYGLSDRLSLDLTVPYASGSGAVMNGTDASHRIYEYRADGLGDISLQADYWLSNPAVPSRVAGSVGLGIKAPTGSDSVQGTIPSPTGDVQGPIDETFQLGNGGWEILVRAQGTAQIAGPLFAYGSGYYGVSLNEKTDVLERRAFRAVPDTYSARLGAAYLLPVLEGFVVTLGGRINGVTVRDVIGGGDLYWRRPGYEIFVEPGLTWTLGANSASVSYPIRAYQNKLDSLLDRFRNVPVGAAFVPYLFLASYARRF